MSGFQPFDIQLVAQRLRIQAPDLGHIAGVSEFAQVKDLRGFRTPSAYVIQAVEQPGTHGPQGARAQAAQVRFGVAIAVGNYRPELGTAAPDELRRMVGHVRSALIGWLPPVPGAGPITWAGGEVVDFDAATLLFLDSYSLTHVLQR